MMLPFPSMPMEQTDDYIRGNVVVKDMFDQERNNWPSQFVFAPRVGDQIQAEDGRRLTVLDIVHTIMDGKPTVRIEIGVDRNNVTPMEGGGGGETAGDPF